MNNSLIQFLQSKIQLNNFKIIYNSETNEFSSREINSKIMGRNNISFIVITSNNDIFGTFHQNSINIKGHKLPIRYKQEGGYFLFSYKNWMKTEPLIFYTNIFDDYLVLYDDEDTNNLIGMCGVFTLKISKSIISSDFNFIYNSKYESNILTNSTFPETFELSQLLIIQWN